MELEEVTAGTKEEGWREPYEYWPFRVFHFAIQPTGWFGEVSVEVSLRHCSGADAKRAIPTVLTSGLDGKAIASQKSLKDLIGK